MEEISYLLFLPSSELAIVHRHSAPALPQLPPFTYFHYYCNLPNNFAYVYFLTWYNQSILCADSDKKQTI